MNNYEYIIASLPVLQQDDRNAASLDAGALLGAIREQLSSKDRGKFDFFLSGREPENLCEDFYRRALASGQGFTREWYAYDLQMRNAKVRYLNSALGRPSGQDVIALTEDDGAADDEEIRAVLERKDILAREKGLDDLLWRKAEDLALMHVFDLDVILSFTARLQIIDRWLRLDPETGRVLFRKLVQEIRNNK